MNNKKTIAQIKQFKDETFFDINLLHNKAYILKGKHSVMQNGELTEHLLSMYNKVQKDMEYIKRRMRIRCRRFYGRLAYPNHQYGRNGKSYAK